MHFKLQSPGVTFYHNVIDKLIECGIEPLVTTYHWDLPQALYDEYNGWESREIIEDFVNYNKFLFNEYGTKVEKWITLNEQNVFIGLAYLENLHPPKKHDLQLYLTANHNAFLANALTIKEFRTIVPNGLIGPSFAYGPCYAISSKVEDVLAMENAQEMNNYYYLDVYMKGEYPKLTLAIFEKMGYSIPFESGDAEILKCSIPDFMGVNYYSTQTYRDINSEETSNNQKGNSIQTVENESSTRPSDEFFINTDNPYVKMTDWNWAIDPQGLRVALRRIESRYSVPTLITENGLGAYDTLTVDGKIHDEYRINFLKEHIIAIENAIEDGCTVLGYCTWSMQDLFSWLNGYGKRYGFIYIDRDEISEKELKRYKKDSFNWYKKVIESNGKDL